METSIVKVWVYSVLMEYLTATMDLVPASLIYVFIAHVCLGVDSMSKYPAIDTPSCSQKHSFTLSYTQGILGQKVRWDKCVIHFFLITNTLLSPSRALIPSWDVNFTLIKVEGLTLKSISCVRIKQTP